MKTTTAETLANWLGTKIEYQQSPTNFAISGFAPLSMAQKNQVSFWMGKSVAGELRNTEAGLLLVPKDFAGAPSVGALARVENPYAAMVRVVEFLHEEEALPRCVPASAKVHESAVVEGVVEENVQIGPHCVVMRGVKIGRGTVLEANVTVYGNVQIGENCVLQAGVVIGSRGFGFYTDTDGVRKMVPHRSGVRIGNFCEFGANSVVAAGFLSPTTIGNHCHFDSFVQIGHNCRVGNNVYMASQSGLGGTTLVEDDCEFAGGAQIAGHLTIGRGAVIAAKAGVTKSVPAGAFYAGFPAEPVDRWRRGIVAVRRLAEKK